jgi:hypothetical protein
VKRAFLFAILMTGSVLAQTPETPAVTFTAEQVRTGRAEYRRFCYDCHKGPADVAPDGTKQPAFFNMWAGKPVNDLMSFLREKMPEDNPGSLDDGTYILILTYLFSENGTPVQATPLPSDRDALRGMRVPNYIPTVVAPPRPAPPPATPPAPPANPPT